MIVVRGWDVPVPAGRSSLYCSFLIFHLFSFPTFSVFPLHFCLLHDSYLSESDERANTLGAPSSSTVSDVALKPLVIMDKETRIRAIQRDSSLDRNAKMAAIQAIHMEDTLESKEDLDMKIDEPCSHYSKKCGEFHFTCCNTIDNCHRCHAENRNCSIRPPQIDEIACLDCGTRQAPGTHCVNEACKIQFSKNHCPVCKIWTEPEISHCVHCGFCRVGKEGTLKHCHDCEQCFAADYFETHQRDECTKKSTRHESCPICLQSIHWNQKKMLATKCGHSVHLDCLERFLKSGNYKCSICRKSLCDMNSKWNEIRYSIRVQPMPSLKIDINDVVDSPYGKFRILGIVCDKTDTENTNASMSGGGRVRTSFTSPRSTDAGFTDLPSLGGHERSQTSPSGGGGNGLAAALQLILSPGNGFIDDSNMYTGVFENWTLARGQQVKATLRGRDVRKVLTCDVHCNDCENDSIGVPFHFLGMECKSCGGFNTQKI